MKENEERGKKEGRRKEGVYLVYVEGIAVKVIDDQGLLWRNHCTVTEPSEQWSIGNSFFHRVEVVRERLC